MGKMCFLKKELIFSIAISPLGISASVMGNYFFQLRKAAEKKGGDAYAESHGLGEILKELRERLLSI
jgi:hypothetical protein